MAALGFLRIVTMVPSYGSLPSLKDSEVWAHWVLWGM